MFDKMHSCSQADGKKKSMNLPSLALLGTAVVTVRYILLWRRHKMVEVLSQCHRGRDYLFQFFGTICISVSLKIAALTSCCYPCTEKPCYLGSLLSS